MNRTNIYLDDRQVELLDVLARQEGVSRASVIRRLLDQALAGSSADLAADLAAIDGSFGALAADDIDDVERVATDRAAHLDEMWRAV